MRYKEKVIRNTKYSSTGKNQNGFSIIEMMIVIVVLGICAVIVVISLTRTKSAYRAEDAALRIIDALRIAQQRALSDRQTYRLVLNTAANRVSIIDEGTIAGGGGNDGESITGDDKLFRRIPLVASGEVIMTVPSPGGTAVPLPPAPFNVPAATYTSGIWQIRFRSDGSAASTVAGTPVSATLYFWPVNSRNPSFNYPEQTTLIRAVTLYGSSGSVRFWKYNGTTFFAEAR